MNGGTNTLDGLAVLVVEDEALVALNLETILEELGCRVAATAMSYEAANRLAHEPPEADVAILDVNLGGTEVYPVAEMIAARGVPIVFATGYGRGGIPEEWHRHPIMQKPYTDADVATALKAALHGAGKGPSA